MSDDADEQVVYGEPTAADRDRLAELFGADLLDHNLEVDPDALFGVVDHMLHDERAHVRVARDSGGEVVGVILANEFASIKLPGRALWIEELYVTPGFRRAGVGRELVEQLLDWAHGAGFAGVELEAYRMNTAASVLYRSLGFRRLARERYTFHMSDWDLED
jgi:GNAT superfamily N-acetyltransferase